ncbi:hypothetical protein A4A49_39108 [Nicotiana attenuata]|uniref:Uncharacterized protein n=1 Tax=Nicotiana attenuata TaxID=49451 RepID=A0A1J6K6F1_NICAT|nr:hypothetical protein A4A49_39108 [Nicotiana attenuata]
MMSNHPLMTSYTSSNKTWYLNVSVVEFLKVETIQHSFMNGDIASTLWKYFGSPLGSRWKSSRMRSYLQKWWSFKSQNFIHQILL